MMTDKTTLLQAIASRLGLSYRIGKRPVQRGVASEHDLKGLSDVISLVQQYDALASLCDGCVQHNFVYIATSRSALGIDNSPATSSYLVCLVTLIAEQMPVWALSIAFQLLETRLRLARRSLPGSFSVHQPRTIGHR
ncbi:hypothetical protein EXIGLDRAFT_215713 [Exidia glandulosa HHB12029]|uniref:Uncharacterized protein n=1 Tax=Exidia glandulosa HHB12029 TaxID=1314781 RepID=A0A165EH25_EXIGL|nr:hypothetical protein EXIGLDRAFT_215713 [Exidia glandulosa HHB12029]